MAILVYAACIVLGVGACAALGLTLPLVAAQTLTFFSSDKSANGIGFFSFIGAPAGALYGIYFGLNMARDLLGSQQGIAYFISANGIWPYGIVCIAGILAMLFVAYIFIL